MELEEAASKYADNNARYKAATANPGEDDEGAGLPEKALTKAELKQLKDEVAEARRDLALIEGDFISRLTSAIDELDEESTMKLVLEVFERSLYARLNSLIKAALHEIEKAFRVVGEKYALTLRELAQRQETAAARLEHHLTELGYV
jgi:type I restriction enzyme M protein